MKRKEVGRREWTCEGNESKKKGQTDRMNLVSPILIFNDVLHLLQDRNLRILIPLRLLLTH